MQSKTLNYPIKLLFDGAIFYDGRGTSTKRGMFYVAYNLLKQFMKDKRFDITLWFEKNLFIKCIEEDIFLKNIKRVFSNFYIEQGEISKIIKNPKFNTNDYDAYINVGHGSQLAFSGQKPPKFNFLHDSVPVLEQFGFYEGTGYIEYFRKFHSKLSSDIWTFCVSENTKKDFLKHFNNLDENKMTVTYLASSHKIYPQKDKKNLAEKLKKYNIDFNANTEYLFYLGSVNDPRKNLVYTVKCFLKFIEKYNITNLYFYLGGAGEEDLKRELEMKLRDAYEKYKDYIVFLGFVSEEDINIFYSNSIFFAFLPLYEGFGIPLLEAMQAGTPVICSNNSSLPEVVGNAAITVDANNEEEIIRAFKELYFNENLRNEYTQKGLERAKMFSWDKTYKLISDKIIDVVSEKITIPEVI